jgi:hypothetical protein
MRRHSIIARLGPTDTTRIGTHERNSALTEIRFIDGERRLGFGLGQMVDQLLERSLPPTDAALDLALLAATVTAADTRISRALDSQDSWSARLIYTCPSRTRTSGKAGLDSSSEC